MKKSELRTGHIVTLRNGWELMVFLNCDPQGAVIVEVNKKHTWFLLENFNDDLTFNDREHCEWDIMKVQRVNHPYTFINIDYDRGLIKTIWERKEKKKYTYAQLKEILGEEFEIVKE